MMNADFIGVKVGDVNGSVVYNARNGNFGSRSTIPISVKSIKIDGKRQELSFDLDGVTNLVGFQMSLHLPGISREDIKVEAGSASINTNHYLIDNELLVISYSDIHSISESENPLFKLILNDHLKSGVNLSSDLQAEVYLDGSPGIEAYDLSIEMNETSSELILLQNTPNPFNDITTIGFILPQDETVTLRIMDLNGRLIHRQQQAFTAGLNSINIDGSTIDAQGILYYQLETQHHSLTKKMILIK